MGASLDKCNLKHIPYQYHYYDIENRLNYYIEIPKFFKFFSKAQICFVGIIDELQKRR